MIEYVPNRNPLKEYLELFTGLSFLYSVKYINSISGSRAQFSCPRCACLIRSTLRSVLTLTPQSWVPPWVLFQPSSRTFLPVSDYLHFSEQRPLRTTNFRKNVKDYGPEARMGWARYASIMYPVGMFIYAWTSFPSVPWIAMTIGIVASLRSSQSGAG